MSSLILFPLVFLSVFPQGWQHVLYSWCFQKGQLLVKLSNKIISSMVQVKQNPMKPPPGHFATLMKLINNTNKNNSLAKHSCRRPFKFLVFYILGSVWVPQTMFIPSVSTLGAASTTGIIATSSTLTKHMVTFHTWNSRDSGMNPFHFGSEKGGVLLKLDLFNPIYTAKQTQGWKNTNSIFLLFLSFTKFQWHILLDHCRSTHVCRIWKTGIFFCRNFWEWQQTNPSSFNSGRCYKDSKVALLQPVSLWGTYNCCSFLFNADSQKTLSNNSTYWKKRFAGFTKLQPASTC